MSLKGYTKCGCPIFDEGARHDPANHRSDDDADTATKPPSRLERAASAAFRLDRPTRDSRTDEESRVASPRGKLLMQERGLTAEERCSAVAGDAGRRPAADGRRGGQGNGVSGRVTGGRSGGKDHEGRVADAGGGFRHRRQRRRSEAAAAGA